MEGIVQVFGKDVEYDFLSGWIKYNRVKNYISQEALAHSICSKSHLSYFENGKKKLRGELIEALLKKMNIDEIIEIKDIGLIREKFYALLIHAESYDFDASKGVYQDLMAFEEIIALSPYNIEFKVYQMLYAILIERSPYSELAEDVVSIDRIYSSLTDELKYIYMLITGKLIYNYKDHDEGIKRLEDAHTLKNTPFINYRLGVAYCLNGQSLKALYFLDKALESYSSSGRYINSLLCHNFLGYCYINLEMYETAEEHLKAMLTGATYFNQNKTLLQVYRDLGNLYYWKGEYEESIKWSQIAINVDTDPIPGVVTCVSSYMELGKLKKCKELFKKYLSESYKNSIDYYKLYFLYLILNHFNQDLFYHEVTDIIIPYYEKKGYVLYLKPIKLKLIEHLESKRRYKEATKIYKELLK